MIKTALVNRYRLQEFIQFISNTLMIVKQHGPEKMKIKELYYLLQRHQEKLQVAYKQTAHSDITPLLASLDTQRDQAIICLRKVSEGYTYHPQEKMRAAAATVLACIDKYGNKLYQLNYSAETAALKNLVRDLQTVPACTAALKDLGLEAVMHEIRSANTKFKKLFIQRLEEFSQDEVSGTRVLNQQTSEAYKTLMQHIDAHATLAPSVEYTLFINHINENIEHFNQMVERRKRSGEAVPEEVATASEATVDTASLGRLL